MWCLKTSTQKITHITPYHHSKTDSSITQRYIQKYTQTPAELDARQNKSPSPFSRKSSGGGRQAQHGGWKFVQTICLTHTFPPFFRVFLGSSVSPRWPLCTASSTLCRGPKISSMKGEKRHEKWKKRWSWFWQYQHFLRRATCFQRHFLDFFVFLFLSLFIGILRVKPLCFCILKGGKEGAKSGSIRMFRQLLVLFRVVGIFFFFLRLSYGNYFSYFRDTIYNYFNSAFTNYGGWLAESLI